MKPKHRVVVLDVIIRQQLVHLPPASSRVKSHEHHSYPGGNGAALLGHLLRRLRRVDRSLLERPPPRASSPNCPTGCVSQNSCVGSRVAVASKRRRTSASRSDPTSAAPSLALSAPRGALELVVDASFFALGDASALRASDSSGHRAVICGSGRVALETRFEIAPARQSATRRPWRARPKTCIDSSRVSLSRAARRRRRSRPSAWGARRARARWREPNASVARALERRVGRDDERVVRRVQGGASRHGIHGVDERAGGAGVGGHAREALHHAARRDTSTA